MNKFLKLTGVSMLAIMTASGANAAGYTCEELVEYTSCNAGYYYGAGVSGTGMVCPDGYTMYTNGVCWDDYESNLSGYTTQSECEANDENTSGADYSWISGTVCVSEMEQDYTTELVEGDVYTDTCVLCPIGSICAGGDVAKAVATPCPAGSYCATAGLSQPTGLCAEGSYSTGGATSAQCTPCPYTGLTDESGALIKATSDAGSTSAASCVVPSGTTFKDAKGTYKYTDNCAFGNFNERADCEAAEDAEWADEGTTGTCYCTGDYPFWNYDREDGIAGCSDANYVSKKSYCEVDYGGTWVWDYENFTGICDCPDDQEWIEDSDESGYCE